MTNVDTPDWQRGIANPQKLLGSFLAGNSPVTISVPSNAEAIWILGFTVIAQTPPTVTGVQTGIIYPILKAPVGLISGTVLSFVVPVSSALDTSLQLTWSGPTLGPWQAVSDIAGRFVVDLAVSATMTDDGSPQPTFGQLIMGSDGFDAHNVRTDSNGRLIPLVPTAFVSASIANGGQLLAAPSVGAWYLFGVSLIGAASAMYTNYCLGSVSVSNIIGQSAFANATTENVDHVPLYGMRVTQAVFASNSVNQNGSHVLLYAPGP